MRAPSLRVVADTRAIEYPVAMAEFELDPRLAADTVFVADWTLCRVLLMNDSRFPWLILVPRRAGPVELFDLDTHARATLIEEVSRASQRLKSWAKADKINVGALGNIVRQFHVHVVARLVGDPAGAGGAWGHGTAIPYVEQELSSVLSALRAVL